MPTASKEEPLIERERLEAEAAAGGMEGDWPPKWMTTYTDLTTLLMTFFVLWYALTMMKIPAILWTVKDDEQKIKSTIAEGGDEVYRGQQNLIEDELVWRQIEQMSAAERLALSEAKPERDKAIDIREFLETGMTLGEAGGGLIIKVVGEDVVIVPTTQMVFPEGSDVIRASFYPLLDKIGRLLLIEKNASIRIEGHSDNTPIHPKHRLRFPTNWELSAARAISVARYLIEKHNIPPERVAASGYGSLLPLYPNDDPGKRALNRRVEFHISTSSETTSKEG